MMILLSGIYTTRVNFVDVDRKRGYRNEEEIDIRRMADDSVSERSVCVGVGGISHVPGKT